MKVFAALLGALALAGCSSNYQLTFDPADHPEPIELHVVPIVNQQELAIDIIVADSSSVGAQYGLLGALVSSAIDASVNSARAKEAERRAEVIRNMTADYDFVQASQQMSLNIDNGDRWKILQVDNPIASERGRAIAEEILQTTSADAVVLLDIEFILTPDASQLRGDVLQSVYLRSDYVEKRTARSDSTRLIRYLSPVHTVDYRAFRDGEREALMDDLRAEYAAQIDARPDEADALNRALEDELKTLADAESIPEHVALSETWTTELLTGYTDQAVSHLTHMIRLDWAADAVPETEQRTGDVFIFGKGEKLDERDGNAIYRAEWGQLYSVPM